MSKELSPAQITQLGSLMEDPKIAAQFRALLGLKDEDTEASSSKQDTTSTPSDANSGKKKKEDEASVKDNIDAKPRAPVESASDILALTHDFILPRRVRFEQNSFTPNASGLFKVLFEADKILIRTFKARRSAQLLSPIHNVAFIAFAFNYQIIRCMMSDNRIKRAEDIQFFNTLLASYPPESIPIPGPLLPFFKAVCNFTTQNEQFRKTVPVLPNTFINKTNVAGEYLTTSRTAPFIPILPLAFDLVRRFHADFNNIKTPAHTHLYIKAPWPFTFAAGAAPPYEDAVRIGGYEYDADPAQWDGHAAQALSNSALRYRPPYNSEILKNLDGQLENYELPYKNAIPANYNCNSLAKWFLMHEDSTWLESWLPLMEEYASLFSGSGSLADCSVDGPPTGAYVHRYDMETARTQRPVAPFDPAAVWRLKTKVYTTQGTPEPMTEKIAAFTQVHARLDANHNYSNSTTSANTRAGNVWDSRPIYGPSNEVTNFDTVGVMVRRFIRPDLLK